MFIKIGSKNDEFEGKKGQHLKNLMQNVENFDEILRKECTSCVSRKTLENSPTLAIRGVDTVRERAAENLHDFIQPFQSTP